MLKIYVDTSVLGGYFDPEFEEWSKRLFNEFFQGTKKVIISDITLNELENAPEKVKALPLRISEKNKEIVILSQEAKELAVQYIAEKVVTEKFLLDA